MKRPLDQVTRFFVFLLSAASTAAAAAFAVLSATGVGSLLFAGFSLLGALETRIGWSS